MGREIEVANEFTLDATPEQVWEAVATGPGMSAWFMGQNEVEPGGGGTVRTCFGAYTPESAITTWEPPRTFAYRSATADDGRFLLCEFHIEGRDGGRSVLRTVASGFIPGDDWEDEYEAMTLGWGLFAATLAEYLAHFAGRTATPITAFGPLVADWDRTWATLYGALGLTGPVAVGDRVRVTPDGLAPIEGVIYFVNPHTLGIRSGDALYRFLRGLNGPMIAGHHLFADVPDQQATERDWEAWLTRLFA